MRSATATTPSTPSAWPRTGRRHWADQRPTPTSTGMNPRSFGFTAPMNRTRRWTSRPLLVLIRRYAMSAARVTSGSAAGCTLEIATRGRRAVEKVERGRGQFPGEHKGVGSREPFSREHKGVGSLSREVLRVQENKGEENKGEENKECHAQMRRIADYGRSTPPSNNGFQRELWSTTGGFMSLPLSFADHRLAILVNQGSDPTVPYQALVIRESAKLC
jgi:hypothetical protein